jgi:hypothetical protein
MESSLSPDEVVLKLQKLTGSRYGFTAFHVYDRNIEGRVWANEFWVERHNRRRSTSRRLLIRIFAKGTGSEFAGYFCIPTESLIAAPFGLLAVLFAFYQSWKVDKSGGELAVLCKFLALSAVIIYLQRRRGLRDEPILLRFVEETLDAKVIVS